MGEGLGGVSKYLKNLRKGWMGLRGDGRRDKQSLGQEGQVRIEQRCLDGIDIHDESDVHVNRQIKLPCRRK